MASFVLRGQTYSWILRPSRSDGLELAETLLPRFETVYNQYLHVD